MARRREFESEKDSKSWIGLGVLALVAGGFALAKGSESYGANEVATGLMNDDNIYFGKGKKRRKFSLSEED